MQCERGNVWGEERAQRRRRHRLPGFSALRSKGKQSWTESTGREWRKREIKNYGMIEGKCPVVPPAAPLGRRVSNQRSQTLVGLGITVYPAKMRADPLGLGWSLVLWISFFAFILLISFIEI